jgi:hypothetical protein
LLNQLGFRSRGARRKKVAERRVGDRRKKARSTENGSWFDACPPDVPAFVEELAATFRRSTAARRSQVSPFFASVPKRSRPNGGDGVKTRKTEEIAKLGDGARGAPNRPKTFRLYFNLFSRLRLPISAPFLDFFRFYFAIYVVFSAPSEFIALFG